MIEFPFSGGTVGDDIFLSPQRTVNLYPEVGQYKTGAALIGWPGDNLYASLGQGPIRGSKIFKDHSVVVSGSGVYKVAKGGIVSTIGTLTTASGFVGIAESGLELMIVDGVNGFIWNGDTFTQILDAEFIQLNSDSVAYLDNAFWVNRPGTGQFYGSNVLDASTWTATKLASAEYKSDNITKIWTDRELMIGGDTTVQVYYNSGASPMPMEPLRQGRLIYGVASKDSIKVVDNTTHGLFVDENGGVFAGRLNGYTIERISTRGLERYWYSIDYTDAYALAIHFGGHEFYVLTFPQADTGRGRTFAYEAESRVWFEIGNFVTGINDFEKYHALTHFFFDGKNLIGDESGDLWALDSDVYTFQGANEILSVRRCPVIHDSRDRLFFDSLEFDLEVGNGLNSGQGSDPKMTLKISDDGGRTFNNQRETSIGAQGKYEERVKFHQLGSSHDRVFEIMISDPVPRRIMGAYLE
jgi:hypothetical protein